LGDVSAYAERLCPHHVAAAISAASLHGRGGSGPGTGVEQPDHEFWPDDISVTDVQRFDHSRILGPNQVTDIYLLGLALKNGGRLVTFDRGLPTGAAHGAQARNIVVL
jgi:predicted nucleic acid-binding protein